MTKFRAVLLLSLLPFVAACAETGRPVRELPPPAPTSYFTAPVRSGDTVKDLAARYRVKEDDLVAMNDFQGRKVSGGSVRIPAYGVREPVRETKPAPKPVAEKSDSAPSAVATPRPAPRTVIETQELDAPKTQAKQSAPVRVASAAKPQTKTDDAAPAAQSSWLGGWFSSPLETAPTPSQKFLWPVKGEVISGFGQSATGLRNDGINISAPRGTPVHAADAGTVTYVGNELKGYGNLVLIQHDNGFVTAYAHSDSVKVERGARVTRGQIIAYTGETGDVGQPQVHFEIRYGTRPVDPKPYMVASK